MVKKVGIYGRVSTEKQIIEGFGLDIQFKELIEEAVARDLDYKKYIDSGISGTSINKRDGLMELLKDVEDNIIDEVWVTKLSRLGRNTRDVLNIIHKLEMHNVVFKSIRDGIDTSNHMGKVMLQFMSIISEMERDVIIETTRAGADYRATIGKIYGSPPIFGYDRVGTGKNSYLEVNVKEAKIIRLIYKLYIKGKGYKAIVTEINNRGYKGKKGQLFSIGTIRRILTNPLYIGKIRYNKYKDWNLKRRKGIQDESAMIFVEGLHKNIISKNIWKKAQDRMSRNRINRNVISGKYLLTGILKCPTCSSSMVGITRTYPRNDGKRIIKYYICGSYHNKGKKACNTNSINVNDIENLVIRKVLNRFRGLYLDEMYKSLNKNNRLSKQVNLSKESFIKIITNLNEIITNQDNNLLKKQVLRLIVKEINVSKRKPLEVEIKIRINEDFFEKFNISIKENIIIQYNDIIK